MISETVEPLILKERRKEEINKEKPISTISNIITYTIYIFLLITLATAMNGQNTYYQKEQVEKLINVSVTFITIICAHFLPLVGTCFLMVLFDLSDITDGL